MSTEATPTIDPAAAPAAAAAIFNPPAPPTQATSPVTVNVTAPATPTPAPATPPTTPAPSAGPTKVEIPLDQLTAFTQAQMELAQIKAAEESRRVEHEREKARVLAQKGEVEKALELLRKQSEEQVGAERQRLAQIEERAKRYALDGELSRALAAQNLVPGGADQLTQLWRNQFTVEADGDTFRVRTPTFQSVGDFVAQQLSQPHYAHFVRAQTTQGGTAGGPSSAAVSPTPPPPEPPPQPRNLGEAVIMQMQQVKQDQGDGRLNMGLGMGLRAAR